METKEPKKIEYECASCHFKKQFSAGGEFYQGKWFCSHTCRENYQDDKRDRD